MPKSLSLLGAPSRAPPHSFQKAKELFKVTIVLVSGPCGSGKTSISQILAKESPCRLAVHMHSDDFYQYIRKGYIPPWQDDSGDQNEIVIRAAAACAEQYALGGYQVYMDGVIGPWFLENWKNLGKKGLDIRYVVLRPSRQETVARAMEREKGKEFPLLEENIVKMWELFQNLGEYERHVVDTTGQSLEESVRLIQTGLQAGEYRL